MAKNETPRKTTAEKTYTRAQAEKQLAAGADPARFTKHGNYHVRNKAFKLMGSPFPEDVEERAKLCKSLHIKDSTVVAQSQIENV